MKALSRVVTPLIKAILSAVCRLDAGELAKVPAKGPLIVVMNHINFLEVPLIYALLYPRPAVGLVKRETWKNPLLRALANLWEAIPIDRAGTDLSAMRRALAVLEAGGILLVAPEGTRSVHGRLQKGHGGVIQLAVRSGAPIMPVVHWGGESFWVKIKKARRTAVHFKVGEAFTIAFGSASLSRTSREKAIDEVMRRIAALLPEGYRGVYSAPPLSPERHLEGLA